MKSARLKWSHGQASMQSLGAMLAPIEFDLPDGRRVAPMHTAPWTNDELPADAPPILQSLRGEWPCVPFGSDNLATLDADWRNNQVEPEKLPHGFCSNAHWQLSSTQESRLTATIDYPSDSAVSRLERHVSAVEGKARVELELFVKTRETTSVPVGLHPVFRLPQKAGSVNLKPGHYQQVWIHPGHTGGPSAFTQGAVYDDLTALPDVTHRCIDATRLPFAGPCEELLFLTGTQGHFEIQYPEEHFKVVLQWNPDDFPSVMLWISNRGRLQPPWNGRHLALAVEPVCAAFDLGTGISTADNPLSLAGVKTAIQLAANSVWRTHYSIAAEPL